MEVRDIVHKHCLPVGKVHPYLEFQRALYQEQIPQDATKKGTTYTIIYIGQYHRKSGNFGRRADVIVSRYQEILRMQLDV